MRFALTGAKILDGADFSTDHAVILRNGLIEALVHADQLEAGIAVHDLGGGYLAPGFFDIQVNGGGGALLNENTTVEGVATIARSHRRFGTTGLLPTVITDDRAITEAAIAAVSKARRAGVPGIIGIHIEGPFLDPKRRGAHPPAHIRLPDEEDFRLLASADCGVIVMTVSPSTVSPEIIHRLANLGIIVCLGHSDATYEETEAALKAGARGFTHLFNAMSQMTNRAPGMVGAALANRAAFCGLIADGLHVHPATLRVAIAAKPAGTLALVTDAMPTAAGGPDRFELQGREVLRSNGKLTLADGTLAGSDLTMDAAVRYCVRELGVALPEALRMASTYPAAFVGIDAAYGKIAAGYRADLVHLNADLKVTATWIAGEQETA